MLILFAVGEVCMGIAIGIFIGGKIYNNKK